MLQADSVTRLFGAKAAVDRVTFTLDRTAFLGIIGRSGAGKSTLLRVMNRMTDATSGRILFDGTDVLALTGPDRRAWQSQCAMIFQQF
ncbi:MAG: ATP-binding cassette domain-containing protein, partial [Rhodobacter sp.]|nr:ATP-binding cassette domain-containing protein [Rhodobacter sp.]